MILGSGFKSDRPKTSNPLKQSENLTLATKIRALAALEWMKSGGVDTLIFSGGQTAGESWISDALAMKIYASKHAQDKLKKDIDRAQVEGSSVDTFDNIDKILSKIGSGKVEVLSTWSHLLRSCRIFRGKGVYIRTVPAELELLRDLKQYGSILREYVISPNNIMGVGREWILNLMLIPDPDGKFLRNFSQYRGKDNR